MSRYDTGLEFGSRFGLQMVLFMELVRRCGFPIRDRSAEMDMCRFDAGYCLDAPELMPAGYCRVYIMESEPEIEIPEQAFVLRE